MSEELKPVCCGCGGEAFHDTTRGWIPMREDAFVVWHRVICKNCGTQTKSFYTEAEAIQAWNKAMGSAEKSSIVERKWHINFDPYDESTSPKEKGYYRIIEEDGTEKTDYFFGEPRMTGHGIGYWATSEKTIIAWTRLEWK